jgi:hypothetical protein
MRRGTKQLARKTPIQAKTELKSGTKPMRKKRATPRRQTRDETLNEESGENDWSLEVRREVRLRSGGMCELRCNRIAEQMHHRKLRGHGDHRAVNCLHICRPHPDWIHGAWVHDKTRDAEGKPYDPYRLGWLVRSTLDPADVPVELPEIPVGA